MEFLWGAAISAQQTEKHTTEDWAEWYEENSRKEVLKNNLYRRFVYNTAWRNEDTGNQMRREESYRQESDTIDHSENFRQDYKLASQIGLNALRFSIPWSKIQPSRGEFNKEAIEHYKSRLKYLRELDIEPVVTLWHFDQPKWFSENGGWTSEESHVLFRKYVDRVSREFDDLVDIWTPLNEPVSWVYSAYLFDGFPPLDTRRRDVFKAYYSVIEAQMNAYKAIKQNTKSSKVGIASTAGFFEPYSENILNKKLSSLINYIERDSFLDECEGYLDFIGVNNYFHYKVDFLLRNHLSSVKRSDLQWPLSPEGVAGVAERMNERYNLPVMVTEHGLADCEDERRGKYIENSIQEIEKAKSRGAEINGYIHWSLIDNVEWMHGRWPRFGLIEIDYETGERKLRDSARDYSKIIKNSSLESSW